MSSPRAIWELRNEYAKPKGLFVSLVLLWDGQSGDDGEFLVVDGFVVSLVEDLGLFLFEVLE